MRIAQISPLFEAVPPKLYGGTERVVYSLTEELVAMGHDVTLFASGDSITSATLAPMRDQALRLDPIRGRLDRHLHADDGAGSTAAPTSSTCCTSTPTISRCRCSAASARRFVTTLHGRLDIPEFKDVYETVPDAPFVSISEQPAATDPAT